MKNKLSFFVVAFALLISQEVSAQNGKENIEKLCGCFSVNFRYAETFSPVDTYKYHDREELDAVELVVPVERSDKGLALQHLLVINDSTIIKHWREEWTYESSVIYRYKGNKTWARQDVPVAERTGTWTQSIWEVNDEPRYQGTSRWITNDGKTYWESTADAPLPRREYTTRDDYNILKRHNRLILTKEGYTHEQDNEKTIRSSDGSDKLLAEEKGYNTYHRLNDAACASAKAYWQKNEDFWKVVRDNWKNHVEGVEAVTVKNVVEDKTLNEYFGELWQDWSIKKLNTSELDSKVKDILSKFL